MTITCDVIFENSTNGTYFAGEVMKGKVTLKMKKAQRVKGVVLKIIGSAHTSWFERTTLSGEARFGGEKDYVNSDKFLLGSPESTPVNIGPGTQTLDFAFHIPETCPSSFEGDIGHVRYEARVTIIKLGKLDQIFIKRFNVLKEISWYYENLHVPATVRACKTFSNKSDVLEIDVTIPHSVFLTEQLIPITLLVNNKSNVNLKRLKIYLVQLVCYGSDPPLKKTQTERKIINKFKMVGVPRQSTKNTTQELLVPTTTPSSIGLCRIIKISYQLEIKAILSGNPNQMFSLPLIIGDKTQSRISHKPGNIPKSRAQQNLTSIGHIKDATPVTSSYL